MIQDDKEFLKEFLRGVVFTISVVGLLILFVAIFGTSEKTPQEQSNNFEVVDSYNGCDVVRWENSSLAEYKYFLYCNNTVKNDRSN